jgi:phospholipid/cholesterol/gamma-HCH transport system substrate-binding protein
LFVGERVPYQVLLKGSSGVKTGDRVRFAGVSVGRIQSVALRPENPWPVLVHVDLKPAIPVRENSSAAIATSGLMGASFLQILPGTADSPLLAPGGTIRGQEKRGIEGTLASVEAISGKVQGILDQTSILVDQVSAEVGPILAQLRSLLREENVEEFGAILIGVRTTIDDVSPRVTSLLDRLDSIARGVEGGMEGMPEVMTRVSALLEELDAALGPDGSRLAELLDAANSGLGSAEDALSVIRDNRGEIEALLHDLRDTVANLEAFSDQLRRRPSSLIRSTPEPDRRPGQVDRGGSR